MATRISESKGSIIFENSFVTLSISKKDSLVESIIDKRTGGDIKGEDTRFFNFFTKELEDVATKSLDLKGDVITINTEKGSFDVKAKALDNYFTFEVISSLPQGIYKAHVICAKFNYDYKNKENTGAVTIPITIKIDPVFYPDAKSLETRCRIFPHLADVGAKVALIIAPINKHKEIIKEASLTIDRNTGIVSMTGGAWSRDSRLNFTNYTIQLESSKEFIKDNIEYFKEIGVDQIDLHQYPTTFRQGDFKFMRYENGAEFKKNVSDVLAEHGMPAGLHTYSFYLNYGAETLLSKPEYLKQLKVLNRYTLSKDISESDDFIFIDEDVSLIATDRGFCKNNSPMILIDDELIQFNIAKDGLRVAMRGAGGSKISSHKKGAAVDHIEGHYGGLTPVFGSELFLEVARLTAKAYNEGGFNMIYLDALDGIHYHCDRGNEDWYYLALFVLEVLKNCHDDPVLEAATFMPSMWAARGRIGALDVPYRGYKNWNIRHTESNKTFIDRHSAPILGWYNFYPTTDKYPANEHTKYHHTDAIEHIGSIAIMYDFPNVFNSLKKEHLQQYQGMKRNVTLYKKYDDLRKKQYFTNEYLEKIRNGKWEYHLREKRGGRFYFVEKDYQMKKLFDLSDSDRRVAEFKNPFGAQVPFVRIEALHSTLKTNPMVMMKLNENVDLTEQKLSVKYGTEIDFSDNLAKTVKVWGNGKKGGKIAIKIRCGTNSELGYGEYIVDTDFVGVREFVLIESDNGERNDHGFEKSEDLYGIFRSSLNHDRLTSVEIETEGDMTGVRMSSIIAYQHIREIYKNPTVKIGEAWLQFEYELPSGDYIEWDGKTAKAFDRYGNERTIWFTQSEFKAPRGKFKASLEATALNRCVPRAQLTFGFTGKEIR